MMGSSTSSVGMHGVVEHGGVVDAHGAVSVEAQVGGDTFTELFTFVDDQVRRGATRFLLAQKGDQHALNDWPANGIHDTHTLATGIYTAASREANALRESVVYVLYAQRGASQSGKCSFRVDGGPHWQAASDGPNERDVIGMLIRHNEGTTRLSLAHSRDIVGHHEKLLHQGMALYEKLLAESERHLEKAHARIAVLEARETERMDLHDQLRAEVSNLALAREDLALAREEKRADSQRKDLEVRYRHEERSKALAQLQPYGTALLSLMAPGLAQVLHAVNQSATTSATSSSSASDATSPADVAPPTAEASPATGFELVERFFLSLDQAQLGQIAVLLKPEQVSLVSALYDMATDRMRRRAAAAGSATTDGGTAADAAGASEPPNAAPSPKETSSP